VVFALIICISLIEASDPPETGRDGKPYGRGKPAAEHPTLGRDSTYPNRLDRRPDDNRLDRYPDSYPNRLDGYPDRLDGYPDSYGEEYPYRYDNGYGDPYYPDGYTGGYDEQYRPTGRYPSRYPDRYSERYRYGDPCGPYSWYYRDDCRRYYPRRQNQRRRRVCRDAWSRNPWLC